MRRGRSPRTNAGSDSSQGARGERNATDGRLVGGSRATLDAATRSADMQERGPDMKEGKGTHEKTNMKGKQQKHRTDTCRQVSKQAGKENQQ